MSRLAAAPPIYDNVSYASAYPAFAPHRNRFGREGCLSVAGNWKRFSSGAEMEYRQL